jgi:hypothetical protein
VKYSKRLKIWETNCGRDAGWIVERNGQPIAILSNPRSADMFWDSYDLEIIAEDSDLRQRVSTVEFWDELDGMIYRSRVFGDIVEHAFPAASPFPSPGRLSMRGLYLSIGEPKPWDRVMLWLRAAFSKTGGPRP